MLRKYLFSIICVFLFIFFLLFANRGLDPDFGWHLRLGGLILKNGIPVTDPFSYSMPAYPFVDHEWLTNIAIAILYLKIGLYGLSFIYVLIAFSALLLQTVKVNKKYIIFPFVLSGIALANYLGIRPQILSWLFVSLLLLLFLNPKLWNKFRFFLPLLLLAWVNLHGSFALGMVLLGVFILAKQIQVRKVLVMDWAIVFVSLAVTFINPYGWRTWWEVGMQMSDASLRWSIQEWFPAFFFFNVGFIFLLPISLLLVWRYRKKFEPYELALYFILLFFGISSIRHLPFWLLISIPMTTRAIEYFTVEIKKIPFAVKRFRLFSAIYFLAFAAVFLINILFSFIAFNSSRTAMYPEKAVVFLQSHPGKGNIFSHYNWGGYLIWKYPQKKVFVDGRMPSWRQRDVSSGSSKNAFKEYKEVMDGESNLKQFLAKYNIDIVMLSSGNERDFPAWLEEGIEKALGVKFPNQKLLKKQLEKEGMRVVYKDEVVVIYRI